MQKFNTLLRVQDVAKILNFNPLTVYQLIRQGELRAVKLGTRYRILDTALDEFIKKNTVHVTKQDNE